MRIAAFDEFAPGVLPVADEGDHSESFARERSAEARRRIADLTERSLLAQQFLDSMPVQEFGWPTPAVALLGALAVCCEVPAAWLVGMAFGVDSMGIVLAIAFAVGAVSIGFLIGEIGRRKRTGSDRSVFDTVLVASAALAAVAYVATTFWLRLAFLSASSPSPRGSDSMVSALSVAAFSLIGIVMVTIGAYHRESAEVRAARRKIAHWDGAIRRLSRADARWEEVASARALEPALATAGDAERPVANSEWINDPTPLTPLPAATTERIQRATEDLGVRFRGSRDGFLFFRRIDSRETLSDARGLELARAVADAIRRTGSSDAIEALERHRGVTLG